MLTHEHAFNRSKRAEIRFRSYLRLFEAVKVVVDFLVSLELPEDGQTLWFGRECDPKMLHHIIFWFYCHIRVHRIVWGTRVPETSSSNWA